MCYFPDQYMNGINDLVAEWPYVPLLPQDSFLTSGVSCFVLFFILFLGISFSSQHLFS